MANPEETAVQNGDISLNVTVEGSGPLVLLVHGFPELSRSWRHQMGPLAASGYTAAAVDVRGYGKSSKPADVNRYSLAEMVSDFEAVIDALSTDGRAVLVGHDWGAGLVQGAALLVPERIAGIASLSTPTLPWSDTPPSKLISAAGEGRFFYQDYFLEPGVAEQEFEKDLARFVRRLFFGLSGASADPLRTVIRSTPADSMLDELPDPERAMEWMPDEEIAEYVAAFERGGLVGPLNRYRAQDLDWEQLRESADERITPPGLFIGGSLDPVRYFVPGFDLYEDPASRFADCRGVHFIEGVGHWTQQEAPDQVNRLLLEFFSELRW